MKNGDKSWHNLCNYNKQMKQGGDILGAFSTLRMPSAIFYGQGSFQKVGEEAGLRGNRA